MKYLDCVELLNNTLCLLKSGQRSQVAISKVLEMKILIKRCHDRACAYNLPMLKAQCVDLLDSMMAVTSDKSLHYIPYSMKQILVKGVRDCLYTVSVAAWDYYSRTEVPLNDPTIPLLKTIVEYYYAA